jgi:hypothetical protein
VLGLGAARLRAFCGRLTFAFFVGRLAERLTGRAFRLFVFFTVRRFAFDTRLRAFVFARLATAPTLSYS